MKSSKNKIASDPTLTRATVLPSYRKRWWHVADILESKVETSFASSFSSWNLRYEPPLFPKSEIGVWLNFRSTIRFLVSSKIQKRIAQDLYFVPRCDEGFYFKTYFHGLMKFYFIVNSIIIVFDHLMNYVLMNFDKGNANIEKNDANVKDCEIK